MISLLLLGVARQASPSSLETIQDKVAQFLKRPGIRSADWGIEIVDPSDDKVLLSVNPDKPFLPASIVKTVTTAAALEKLGPDFRFRTGLYTNGELKDDGTLEGDLILVGRGDPNLADVAGDLLSKPALACLSEDLRRMGVHRITGDVIGDDSYFDFASQGGGWTAQDLRSPYGAPISALSVNDNVVWVHASPTTPKKRVSVSLEPRNSYFRVRNLAVTGSRRARRTLRARLVPGTRTIVVSGVLPSRLRYYTQHIVIPKPAEFAAGTLKYQLQDAGVEVEGDVRAIHRGDIAPGAKESWKPLTEHLSPPLVHALQLINKRSNNLHAEMLLRVLGAEFGGDGTDQSGLQIVREFLVEAGIESSRVQLNDGSGLSRENIMTPRFQTSLLMYLSASPQFELFLNTLSVSGIDGTLKHRLSSEPLKGVIYAKTGTMNGVATLSGYMRTRSGRNLVFSIFANNFRASLSRVRRTIDEICALFVNLY